MSKIIAKWSILVLLFSAVVAVPFVFNETEKFPVKEIVVSASDTAVYEEIATIPRWDEMTVTEQFNSFEDYYCTGGIIPESKIGDSLGAVTLQGYDEYDPEAVHEITAEFFTITGINEKCAKAARYEGDENYYSFVNTSYRPATLSEFADDLSLKENLTFGTVYQSGFEGDEYVSYEFYGITAEEVWDLLLSDNLACENIHSDNMMLINDVSISTNLDILGYHNISIAVTEDGYLTTNILSTGKTFYIGTEKADAFIKYVRDNLEGCKIKYIFPEEEPEDTPAESGIVSYNVETGETTYSSFTVTGDSETSATAESVLPSE